MVESELALLWTEVVPWEDAAAIFDGTRGSFGQGESVDALDPLEDWMGSVYHLLMEEEAGAFNLVSPNPVTSRIREVPRIRLEPSRIHECSCSHFGAYVRRVRE